MTGEPEEYSSTTDVAIGRALVRLRAAAGWTQQDLAEKMRERGWQWTQPAVAKVELGKRPVRLAEAADLAQLFQVKTQDLLASPLDDAISALRSRHGKALRTVGEATAQASRTEQSYRTLDEIRRAAAGERVNFGPIPEAGLLDAFRELDWDDTCAILRQLGADEQDLSDLTRARKTGGGSPSAKQTAAFLDRFWSLLQRLVPTLYVEPE